MARPLCALTTALLLLSLPGHSQAKGDPAAQLAARLAALRSEVEQLSQTLEAKKEEQRGRLRSLADQRSDLELQLRREGLRQDQLRAAQARQREKLGERGGQDEALRPVVERGLAELQATIRGGLPFRQEERLAETQKLRSQLQGGLLTPQEGAYRLWQLYEEELRLTRESGLYRQTISLDGRQRLAEVARLGMIALFFKTSDGRYGRAVPQGASWRYELLPSADSRRQLASLFDAFKKQVRVGLFQLPAALPQEKLP